MKELPSGLYILQVDDFRDLSRPIQQQHAMAGNPKRCLKLGLTDGVSNIVGIEHKSLINQIKENLKYGTKVLISGPVPLMQGILRLEPHHIVVLGGSVQHLQKEAQLFINMCNAEPGPRQARMTLEQFISGVTAFLIQKRGEEALQSERGTVHNHRHDVHTMCPIDDFGQRQVSDRNEETTNEPSLNHVSQSHAPFSLNNGNNISGEIEMSKRTESLPAYNAIDREKPYNLNVAVDASISFGSEKCVPSSVNNRLKKGSVSRKTYCSNNMSSEEFEFQNRVGMHPSADGNNEEDIQHHASNMNSSDVKCVVDLTDTIKTNPIDKDFLKSSDQTCAEDCTNDMHSNKIGQNIAGHSRKIEISSEHEDLCPDADNSTTRSADTPFLLGKNNDTPILKLPQKRKSIGGISEKRFSCQIDDGFEAIEEVSQDSRGQSIPLNEIQYIKSSPISGKIIKNGLGRGSNRVQKSPSDNISNLHCDSANKARRKVSFGTSSLRDNTRNARDNDSDIAHDLPTEGHESSALINKKPDEDIKNLDQYIEGPAEIHDLIRPPEKLEDIRSKVDNQGAYSRHTVDLNQKHNLTFFEDEEENFCLDSDQNALQDNFLGYNNNLCIANTLWIEGSVGPSPITYLYFLNERRKIAPEGDFPLKGRFLCSVTTILKSGETLLQWIINENNSVSVKGIMCLRLEDGSGTCDVELGQECLLNCIKRIYSQDQSIVPPRTLEDFYSNLHSKNNLISSQARRAKGLLGTYFAEFHGIVDICTMKPGDTPKVEKMREGSLSSDEIAALENRVADQ